MHSGNDKTHSMLLEYYDKDIPRTDKPILWLFLFAAVLIQICSYALKNKMGMYIYMYVYYVTYSMIIYGYRVHS